MALLARTSKLVGITMIAVGVVGCGSSLTGPGIGPTGGAGRRGGGGVVGDGGTLGAGGTVGMGGVVGQGGDGALGGVVGSTTGLGGTLGKAGNNGGGGALGAGGGCNLTAVGEVPSEHRPTPVTCAPNVPAPLPDGGVPSCATSADCVPQGYGACTHGQCVSDYCLADGDCQSGQVCVCSAAFVFGPPLNGADAGSSQASSPDGGAGTGGTVFQAYPINICVTALCRMDSDCGPGGYCSPSYGICGPIDGYYCHGPADTCLNASDCTGCGGHFCGWSSATGAFSCSQAICL